MDVRRLITDDSAVSPVIGVVLMVGITLILVAVAGPEILNSSNQFDAPDAEFDWDYDSDTDELRITHNGGDAVDVSQLYLRGSGLTGPGSGPNSLDGEGSVDRTLSDRMSTGEYVTTAVSSDYRLTVVYVDDSGEKSVVLSENVGPDA